MKPSAACSAKHHPKHQSDKKNVEKETGQKENKKDLSAILPEHSKNDGVFVASPPFPLFNFDSHCQNCIITTFNVNSDRADAKSSTTGSTAATSEGKSATTSTTDSDPWIWREKSHFETVYFLSGIALFFIAAFALGAAYVQGRHARKDRLATVYMQVSKGWDELEVERNNIRIFMEGKGSYDDCIVWGSKILDICLRKQPAIADLASEHIQNNVETILSFTEEVGFLCRKNYLSVKDILDVIGDGLGTYLTILLPYIKDIRTNGNVTTSRTFYSNSLWLLGELNKYNRYGISGFGASQDINLFVLRLWARLRRRSLDLWARPRT